MAMSPPHEIEILLVEDNPQDLELTLDALRAGNLANHIHVARDGEEALDFIFCQGEYANRPAESGPRVIMLDLKLPKVDGLAVLKIVKSDERTRSTPIVVLTSSAEDIDLKRAYELGANSYIVKPVDFERFTAAVRDLGSYWLRMNAVEK
jgi:CheY-like chemotaxis protein